MNTLVETTPATMLDRLTLLADDSMIPFEDIVKSPDSAALPNGIAVFAQAVQCAERVDEGNVDAVVQYVSRWPQEEGKLLFLTELSHRAYGYIIVASSTACAELARSLLPALKLCRERTNRNMKRSKP